MCVCVFLIHIPTKGAYRSNIGYQLSSERKSKTPIIQRSHIISVNRQRQPVLPSSLN
ncbi:hypothetical protein Hanom_Chr16g01486091 [Helianthus anomalus]